MAVVMVNGNYKKHAKLLHNASRTVHLT